MGPTQLLSALALAGLVVFSSCKDGDETGVPQPVPIPGPSVDVKYVRTSAASQSATEVHVIGLPGAASRAGEVVIENTRLEAKVQVPSSEAGTFSGFIEASAGDELRLSMVGGQGAAAAVELKEVASAKPAPRPRANWPALAGGGAKAMIGGLGDADAEVLAINLATGAVVTASTGAGDGLFTLELAADDGQRIYLYRDAEPLGEPWRLSVDRTLCPSNDSSLLLCMPMEDGDSPVVTDYSPRGHHGDVVGAVTDVAGQTGRALAFAGAGEHVKIQVAGDVLTSPTEVTLIAWVRLDAAPTAPVGVVDRVGPLGIFAAPGSQPGRAALGCRGGATAVVDDVPLGTWLQIACVGADAGGALNIARYIDGLLTERVVVASSGAPGCKETRVGGSCGDDSRSLPGAVDSVRAFSRLLDAEAICDAAGESWATCRHIRPTDCTLAGSWACQASPTGCSCAWEGALLQCEGASCSACGTSCGPMIAGSGIGACNAALLGDCHLSCTP